VLLSPIEVAKSKQQRPRPEIAGLPPPPPHRLPQNFPSLSPLLGVAIPVVAAAAAVGGGVLGVGREKFGEQVEKRQAERSMLGILATVRHS